MATPTKVIQAPRDRKVKINVNAGKFDYQDENNAPADSVHVPQGGTIEWSSKVGNGTFTVHFDNGRTPCDRADYWGPGPNATGVVLASANGAYKYIVSVQDADGHIHIDDPEVIVP